MKIEDISQLKKRIWKKRLALACSIVAWFVIVFVLRVTADALGIPTYIDYGETITKHFGSGRSSVDLEMDGSSTDVGIYIYIVSAMLAWRIYIWIVDGSWNGSLPLESRIAWRYWMVGMTAFILVTTPVWSFDLPAIVQRTMVLVCAFLIAGFAFERFQRVKREINDDK